MKDFQAILLEGVFYTSEEIYPDSKGQISEGFCDLRVQGQKKSVYETLASFVGQRVRIAIHQLPEMPPDLLRWGGGSCLWQDAGHCPFGHHETPHRIYNVSGEGILLYDLDHKANSGGWWIQRFDGVQEILPLAHALVGHRGRVACATVLTVEEMRDAVTNAGDFGTVEGLGRHVEDLRELVAGLNKVIKEG